jgi:hypothetical protein
MKEKYYPPLPIRLLQQAALAPTPEAQQAWRAWRDLDRLDVVSWQEQKILARMHNRIPELDAGYTHFQRVIGLSKSLWTHSAIRLNASMAAVDLLLSHKVQIMLFKGVAWDKRFNAQGVRLFGDLDILVPEEDFIRALILLEQNNWATESNINWTKRGLIPNEIHGLNVVNKNGGNIDVHRRPSHSISDSNYLKRLWKQSEEGTFMGRPVRFCSHADYLALLVDHGVGKCPGPHMSSIWPVDFHQSINNYDLKLVKDFQLIIQQLRIPLQCSFALTYCKDIVSSERITAFAQHIEPMNVTTADIVRSMLNSPPAFTRGSPLWLIAGSIRRISRYLVHARHFTSPRG